MPRVRNAPVVRCRSLSPTDADPVPRAAPDDDLRRGDTELKRRKGDASDQGQAPARKNFLLDCLDQSLLCVPLNVCQRKKNSSWRGLSKGAVNVVKSVLLGALPLAAARISSTGVMSVDGIREDPFLSNIEGFMTDVLSRMRCAQAGEGVEAPADSRSKCECWKMEQLLTYWQLVDVVVTCFGKEARFDVAGDKLEMGTSKRNWTAAVARQAISCIRTALESDGVVRMYLLHPLLLLRSGGDCDEALPSSCVERQRDVKEKAVTMVRGWDSLLPLVYHTCFETIR